MNPKIYVDDNGTKLFNCPGCEMTHSFDDRWKWNNSVGKPTFTPSLLVRYNHGDTQHRCHSFVTDGLIKFLRDCTHRLAGEDVEIPDWDGIQIKD